MRGWYDLTCWNGLSHAQQRRLMEHGNLPLGYKPEGWCENGAWVSVETILDEVQGMSPRFYCWSCAIDYIKERYEEAQATDGASAEQEAPGVRPSSETA